MKEIYWNNNSKQKNATFGTGCKMSMKTTFRNSRISTLIECITINTLRIDAEFLIL